MTVKNTLLSATIGLFLSSNLFSMDMEYELKYYPPERLNSINTLQYGKYADRSQDIIIRSDLETYPNRAKKNMIIIGRIVGNFITSNHPKLSIDIEIQDYSHILCAAHHTISMFNGFIGQNWSVLNLTRTIGDINKTAFHPDTNIINFYGDK